MSKSIFAKAAQININVSENAVKIQKTIKGLSQIDERLSNWYLTTKPKKNSIVESITDNNLEFFEKLIIKNRNINPDTKEIYLELGSYFSLKSNKIFMKGFGLNFSCCTNSKTPNDGVQLHDPLFQKEMDLSETQIEQIAQLFKEIW